MTDDLLLKEYIALLVTEGAVREADISGDKRAPWGSEKHIADIEKRLSDALYWRNKQRKGTEARANYSRLVNNLKSQLASAKRHAEKQS